MMKSTFNQKTIISVRVKIYAMGRIIYKSADNILAL